MKAFVKKIYYWLSNKISTLWVAINIYQRNILIKFYPRSKASSYFYIGTDEVIDFPLPKNNANKVPFVFKHNSGLFVNKKRLIQIYKDCTILGGGVGMVLDKEKKLLWHVTIYNLYTAHKIFFPFSFFKQKYLGRAKKIDRAVFLHTNWSDTYSHWLFEILARLEFLEQVERADEIKLIFKSNLNTWQKKTLEALGFKNQIIHLDNSNIRVTSLYVPDFPPQEVIPHRQQSLWLRDRILANIAAAKTGQNFSKRILILRKKQHGRFFDNQKELLSFLKQYDFEAVYLEELSFAMQIKLFEQSSIIIAPHGAGLSNLIFANQAKVIEVFPEQDIRYQYFLLSGMMNCDYYFLTAKKGTQKESMQVELKELWEILHPILEKAPIQLPN